MCRLALHLGKRVGGQGVVIFAQHAKVRARKFAVKFFLSESAFDVEMAAAQNPVRFSFGRCCLTFSFMERAGATEFISNR